MGLTIPYFYSLTPRQFYNILMGYRDKEEKNLRISLTQNRKLAFFFIKPYLKNQQAKETDLYTFDWEKPEAEMQDVDMEALAAEAEAMQARWAARDAKRDEMKANGTLQTQKGIGAVLQNISEG